MTGALEAAHALASGIAGEALWHGGRCTWLAPVAGGRGPEDVVDGTLAADLYGGVAGVGLMLAEVAAATGDPSLARTAAGALRQAGALSARRDLGPGLFDGATGVALAAARAARVLDDAAPLEVARACAAMDAARPPRGFDLVGGAAGVVIGRLALGDLARGSAGDAAAHLLDTALGGPDRASWAAVDGRWPAHPTGLAHGASGGGLALAEAGVALDDPALLHGAAGAFAYEDARFHRGAANWRDLRVPGGEGFATAWCHGAPGMLLARHRVRELIGGEPGPHEPAAMGTLARHLRASLRTVGANLSLCHGVCGLAEVAEECDPAMSTVRVRAAGLVVEHVEQDIPLPCGIPGGRSLGLMTGTAGVAHFLVRLADPAVPSVLLMRPAAWAG